MFIYLLCRRRITFRDEEWPRRHICISAQQRQMRMKCYDDAASLMDDRMCPADDQSDQLLFGWKRSIQPRCNIIYLRQQMFSLLFRTFTVYVYIKSWWYCSFASLHLCCRHRDIEWSKCTLWSLRVELFCLWGCKILIRHQSNDASKRLFVFLLYLYNIQQHSHLPIEPCNGTAVRIICRTTQINGPQYFDIHLVVFLMMWQLFCAILDLYFIYIIL